MFRPTKKRILFAAVVLFASIPVTVHAAGVRAASAPAPSHPAAVSQARERARWRAEHPRRDEVNARLAVQNARIDAKEHAGKITPAQAATLHRDDHQIRVEERTLAAERNGHLTELEKVLLNAQEDNLAKVIGPPE